MPIYEYTCHDCGKVFDTIQKISEPPLTQCRCEKAGKVTKNLTAAGFALKGSGWYVTDFRGGNTGAKPAEAKTEGNSEAKTEAKPADASAPAAAPAAAPATPVAPAPAPAASASSSN
jgi:putative FmdB family regulatory protein